MKAVKFAETKPLPSYLVALAVGPFETVDGGKAGKKSTPIRVIVPRGKSAEARYAAEVSGQILAARCSSRSAFAARACRHSGRRSSSF